MSREIKFRCWDKTKKRMIDDCEWQRQSHSEVFMDGERRIHIFGKGRFRESEIEIMQFTGLLDKNRKEIYEGDVIEIDGGLKGKIDFREGAFVWEELDGCWQHLCDEYSEGSKVIGNIYENPELLKGAKNE